MHISTEQEGRDAMSVDKPMYILHIGLELVDTKHAI